MLFIPNGDVARRWAGMLNIALVGGLLDVFVLRAWRVSNTTNSSAIKMQEDCFSDESKNARQDQRIRIATGHLPRAKLKATPTQLASSVDNVKRACRVLNCSAGTECFELCAPCERKLRSTLMPQPKSQTGSSLGAGLIHVCALSFGARGCQISSILLTHNAVCALQNSVGAVGWEG